jgi:transcription initiation factor TFIIH subunit 4
MDQIRLWEYEGERVETTNGFLMRDFGSESEFRGAVNYAEALGVLVWRDDARRMFFIDQIEQMMAYLKKRSQK